MVIYVYDTCLFQKIFIRHVTSTTTYASLKTTGYKQNLQFYICALIKIPFNLISNTNGVIYHVLSSVH